MLRHPFILTGLASALLFAGASGAVEPPGQASPPPPGIWERPELLRIPGGPRDWLASHGIDVDLWFTQFYQGQVSGDGDHSWEYGGRGDLFATADLAKLGLWSGLSTSVHAEGVFGDDVNTVGDGSVLPLNTAMAFPRLSGADWDVSSVFLTQKFPFGIALSFGKIDMLDIASKTPLIGGGGIVGFQNLAFAAPPSGLVPPAIFGGLLSVPIERVKLTIGVYDPTSASTRTGLDDPFAEGVTGMLSVTVPIAIAGRPGYHSLSVKANTKEGLDINDLGGILLPDASQALLRKKGAWNASYSFQQYLYQEPGNSGGGWGIFGQIGRSDANPTPLGWFGYIGLGGDGLIPGRAEDRFGVGFFYLELSENLKDGLHALAGPLMRPDFLVGDEKGGELFYDAAITKWFRLALDMQVVDPHERQKRTAIFLGFRARLIL